MPLRGAGQHSSTEANSEAADYINRAASFFLIDNDSIKYYSLLGVNEARLNQNNHELGQSHLMLAISYSHSGASPDTVRYYIQQAQGVMTGVRDQKYDQLLSLSFGELYHQLNQYDRSIEYYLEYIEQSKKIKDTKGIALGHMRIGQVLRHFGMHDQSIKYHNLAWQYGEEINDTSFHRMNLDYMVFALEDNGQIDSAKHIRNIAQTYRTSGHNASKYYRHADKGFVQWGLGAYDSSMHYFQLSLQYARDQNNIAGIIENYGDMAMMAGALGHPEKADELWQSFISYQSLNPYASNYYLPYLAKHVENNGDQAYANQLLHKFIIQNRKEFNQNLAATVASQVTKYEVDIKDEALQSAQVKLSNQTMQRNILISGLCALLIFSLIGWRQMSMRRHIDRQTVLLANQDLDLQKQKNLQLEKEQHYIVMTSMLEGQETERNRIARELHDGLGGILSSLRLTLDGVNRYVADTKGLLHVTKGEHLIESANKALRRIAQDLMPESLTKFGLVTAIDDHINELNLTDQLQIKFQHFGLTSQYEDHFALTIFRMIQELLHNIIKHADATEVILQLIQREMVIYITVEDNGKGFDTNTAYTGRGLNNVKSRALQYDGSVTIESDTTHGSTISISCVVPHYVDPTIETTVEIPI